MLFQHVVGRNPVHPRRFHRHRGDATTHQPLRHLHQVFGEGREYPHRMLIPVRRDGYKDFSRSNIDSRRIRLQNRTVLQTHPFSFPAPFVFARLSFLLSGLSRMLLLSGHAPHSFCSGIGQVAQIEYSLEGNQPGVLSPAVTTVWRTELGTTLLDGFNSTTDISAYFRYLCSYQSAPNWPAAPSSERRGARSKTILNSRARRHGRACEASVRSAGFLSRMAPPTGQSAPEEHAPNGRCSKRAVRGISE